MTRLTAMPWERQAGYQTRRGGASDGLSHAVSGIAETGTLLLTSGPDNPTTLDFLTDHHIVVVSAADIDGDLETALARVREAHGKGAMRRAVNLISGPSRPGDIEQKLILGAHGPRAFHILVVDDASDE